MEMNETFVFVAESQSSLKRVLVSETKEKMEKRTSLLSVAILFEASPGFGAGKEEGEGAEVEAPVAILFEASPGFGDEGGKISDRMRGVAILFEASPGFGGR